MQNATGVGKPVELSVVLPVLGKGICMEGMLKLLTIDIAVPYEIIVIGRKQELGVELIQRVCGKYSNLSWLEKDNQVGTLGALNQGVDAATGEYILVVCADTAGPVIAVNQMLDLAREGCTFVSGTRYAGGGRRLGGSLLLMTISRAVNGILHSVAGTSFTDCTTGLKLFRKDVFKQLSLVTKSSGWVIAFEMALKAQVAGLKVGEVATIEIDRLYGGDSTSHIASEFYEYVKWFLWAFAKLRDPSVQHSTIPIRSLRLMD